MALFGRKKTSEPDADAAPAAETPAAPVPQITRRSVTEQRAFLLDQVGAIRPFGMQIFDVPGLTLCEDIRSDLDLPLVTTARVGGWAVRGSDLVGATPEVPKELYVVDQIAAGEAPGAPLVAGAAIRIEEGGMIPEGVDAVVPDAYGVLGEDGYVRIGTETRLYDNLRRAGSELADGTPLLAAGDVLTPRSVAVLAEVGLDKVLVRPRPRIVVFTVGDGLVAPGQALTQPQQRYDAATTLITAAARADGATVYPLGIISSDAREIRQTIADQQIRADLIVAVGGGELIREVAEGMGELDEAVVALNRESRYAFAALGNDRTPMVILPAGVVSAYVGYHAFVRPVIHKLNESDPLAAPRVDGFVAERLEVPDGITQYIPAVWSSDQTVRPVSGVDSELAWDLARANVLLVIPEGWAGADAGSQVECIVLDDAGARGDEAVR
ncbi:molybdopterin-binding protein [Propioniciclava soli]|uniref:Molybdopterin molybdenumtransferase n=1 Tax=Propioniciclava soli TaxID=2775081 RepID=A0ABZ3CAE0_9ACTN